MSALCPVCEGPMPDLPTEVPLEACSQSCIDRLYAAARGFLAAVGRADQAER